MCQRSPTEEEINYEREIRPEDVVPDDDMQYASEDDNFEEKPKDKPVGPPLDLEFSSQAPPGRPDKVGSFFPFFQNIGINFC